MNLELCISGILLCAVAAVGLAAERQEILLWPNGMPEPVVPADPPESQERGADGLSRRSNVSQPRLFVHVPPAGVAKSRAAIIVIPGGGFGRLADDHEGSQACEMLAQQGLVAFQLAYRTPTAKHADPSAGPVQDAQKAVAEVRRRASEFDLEPHKIGVLGFSSGGQVALIAATNEPIASVAVRGVSHKPDFLLLLYPWRIYDPRTKGLRADIKLDAGLPPTFVAQMGDDDSSLPQGSTLLFLELVNRKIPAEIHIYERGGHGFGMRPRPNATGPTDWKQRAIDWLQLHAYIAKAE